MPQAGFGILAVSDNDLVDVIVSPIAPMPRKNARRRSRLVDEHRRRKGDPALGGSTRKPIMTAYRQQALVCAAAIEGGVQRPKDMREAAPKAPQILRDNVYGWFERVDRGIYALTELGTEALKRWPMPQS